jgi:hypothetical protein
LDPQPNCGSDASICTEGTQIVQLGLQAYCPVLCNKCVDTTSTTTISSTTTSGTTITYTIDDNTFCNGELDPQPNCGRDPTICTEGTQIVQKGLQRFCPVLCNSCVNTTTTTTVSTTTTSVTTTTTTISTTTTTVSCDYTADGIDNGIADLEECYQFGALAPIFCEIKDKFGVLIKHTCKAVCGNCGTSTTTTATSTTTTGTFTTTTILTTVTATATTTTTGTTTTTSITTTTTSTRTTTTTTITTTITTTATTITATTIPKCEGTPDAVFCIGLTTGFCNHALLGTVFVFVHSGIWLKDAI